VQCSLQSTTLLHEKITKYEGKTFAPLQKPCRCAHFSWRESTEPNPLVARYEENTNPSSFHPSSFFWPVSHLAKGIRKCRFATYFERVEGPPLLCVSSFYLPTYLQSYVGHTYVLNSDEGLTERAPYTVLKIRQSRGNNSSVLFPNTFGRHRHFLIYSVMLPNITCYPRLYRQFFAQYISDENLILFFHH
jgi:hypothetical protein